MIKTGLKFIRNFVRFRESDTIGYSHKPLREMYPDFDSNMIDTITNVQPFTMTSPERIFSLCKAVEYIIINNIPGDIVECGVWKGGSMMAIARTLLYLNNKSRNLYLFDTFEGMSAPTDFDVNLYGNSAERLLKKADKNDNSSIWCYSPLDDVKRVLFSVGYDNSKVHFVKGMVEETIPVKAPSTISLLRLDTDWYESTRHELIHLFPRLSIGGVIIIDDYGHWEGARRAVDEYIKEHKIKLLLNRIDYTGRIGVKLP